MMICVAAIAQEIPASTWGNMPPLHVEGNHLVDPYGNNVVLHGVMDTPSPYFNNYRWDGPGWGQDFTSAHARNAIAYFDKLFTALTDTASGAYCNLFRLHLDPCWTNLNSKKAAGFTEKNGKVYDPHGNEVGGEANIYHFSDARLKSFMKTLYFPIAKKAIDHGMYVIMRPPGVFPGYVEVGDYYNEYIKHVWDIVTQNDSIKKYSGQIMIELGNEPVTVHNAQGKSDDRALCDFFQPVVDKIRENGYEGVVWGVGSGWQGNYRPYGKYPLVGKNLGYAVHNYVGWYGGNDRTYTKADKEKYANEFHASVPVMDTNPVVITEIDWSPEKAGTGHYNEHGDWVLSNYGSWATGNTSKWGAAYKYLLDKYDNISMTLSGTGCYIDIDDYINKKKVTPAYKTAMEKNGLDPGEGSGVACFAWYKEWAKQNYARPDLSQVESEVADFTVANDTLTKMVGQYVDFGMSVSFADGLTSKLPASMCELRGVDGEVCVMEDDRLTARAEGENAITATFSNNGNEMTKDCFVKVVSPFSLSASVFNPSLLFTGSYTERTGGLTTGQNGMGGWAFDAGLDISAYKYLVIQLRRASTSTPVLRIGDTNDYNADCYEKSIGSATNIKIDLKDLKKKDGSDIDTKHICFAGIKSSGSAAIYIKSAFLSMDGETEAVSIRNLNSGSESVIAEEYFNAAGQRIGTLTKGMNIVRQRLSNGEQKVMKIMITE